MTGRRLLLTGLVVASASVGGCAREAHRAAKEGPGKEETAEGKQSLVPVRQIELWLDGMHVMKDDPDHMLEAHHYCAIVNPDLTQCVVYDRAAPDARLVAVEYVIPERAFDELPEAEKAYWHPHNYEILSGQLLAPGLAPSKESALMAGLMNSYGKTWQLWNTGGIGSARDPLPYGDPALAWSFNADNEIPSSLLETRDRRLGVNTAAISRQRQGLVAAAHPQAGVDLLAPRFPNRKPIPGVEDKPPYTKARPQSR